MKKILYILLFVSFSASLIGQNFMREAGVRGGLTSGFTYRIYLDEYLSYESILSFRQSGMQLTLIRQIHEGPSLLDIDNNFNFIYGFGGHAGFFFSDKYSPLGYRDFYYPNRKFAPVLGIDAYAGMEYRMESFPVVFGIDYKPFFEFSLYEYFRMRLFDFAFTAKYRF